MEIFVGTKLVSAKPMSRLDYNEFRGWVLPDDEDGTDEGYLVEYLETGFPNTAAYDGYISWSPKDVFETSYKTSGNLTFGHAIELLKRGSKVCRAGWNGKGMYLVLRNSTNSEMTVSYPYFVIPDCEEGTRKIPYASTVIDIMSEDWCVVD